MNIDKSEINIEKKSNKDKICESILELIIKGKINSGDKISIKEMSEISNMSNTPVREALSNLEELGLFKKIPYKGYKVREFDLSEIEEILQTRSALESFATKLCSKRINKSKKEKLEEIQRIGKKHIQSEDNLKDYSMYNLEFHRTIIKFSNNNYLAKIYKKIEYQIFLFSSRLFVDIDVARRSFKEHDDILNEIINGSEYEARRKIEEHILKSLKNKESLER